MITYVPTDSSSTGVHGVVEATFSKGRMSAAAYRTLKALQATAATATELATIAVAIALHQQHCRSRIDKFQCPRCTIAPAAAAAAAVAAGLR